MRFYEKTTLFLVAGIILTIGFGCKNFQLKDYTETPEEPKKTVITKEVLTERLTARFVKLTNKKPSDKSDSSVESADSKSIEFRPAETSKEKPNPLTLHLKFSTRNDNFLLNNDHKESFSELANILKEVFREREANGIFIEGTNEIYKKITLPAYQKTIDEYNSKNIFVEDFEKLADDLRNAGFDQIELDTNEENSKLVPDLPKKAALEARRKLLDGGSNEPKKSVDNIKSVSGGVLNGKAVELPKPAYPSAAKAVRASGAVNVQVTVDESGEVISASAVSGHALLRAAAESAARAAKFNPTLLSGKAVKVTGIIVYNFAPQ